MSAGCRYEGCTVADTDRCALERDPATCPNRIGNETADDERPPLETKESVGEAVLQAPAEAPKFPSSTTLGSEVIENMMASRYVTVIGILGDPESGKTACLASLYLLVSNAMLKGWAFANSLSLMGFEDIARGARRWNEGHPPEQMTVHTERPNERQPGFLHLALRRNADNRRVDLALPDLPGEWTQALVRSSRSDRLTFLRSADVIWMVTDGRLLSNVAERQSTIVRLGQLAGRVRTLLDGVMPRLLLVISWRDEAEVPQSALQRVAAELAKYDVTAEVFPVAPFSTNDQIDAGFGLAELIETSTASTKPAPDFWPASSPKPGARSFLSYRRDQ